MITGGPVHPGEHLAEFLQELGISQYRAVTGNRSAPDQNQRYCSLPQVYYRGHGLENR